MKDPKKYFLVIDHGTSGIKAALSTVYGEILSFVFEKTPLYLVGEEGAEQNPREWMDALIRASKRLIEKNLVPVEDIIAINCSSQWSGTVAVDKNGNHLGNAIIWMDSRGAPYIKKIFRGFPKISGYPILDILRFIPKTGGAPGLAGKDPIAHILYIKNELPKIYEKTYKFLECKDYLNLQLTGKFAATVDSITLHWVTNTKDINHIDYDRWLLKKFSVPREKFPDLISSIDILGTIKDDIAKSIGVSSDTKVIAGAADLHSAIIGSGATNNYEGHIYIGTSSWVICHVPFKKTDIFHNIASVPSAIPGKYFVANEQETAGACLTFLRDNLFKNETMKEEKFYQNPQIYSYFDEIVKKVSPGSSNLIFTPWLYGERTPVEDHKLRAGFYNISLQTSKEEMIRAVYEGVAYNIRWVLQYVEKFIGKKMDPLNIIGGGAVDIWCQIIADVLNRSIRQVKNPIQANARGVAFLASVALEYITFQDIPNLIRYSKVFQPNPANRERYDHLFNQFKSIYKNNNKMYYRLNR